jgi:hypothetical protein
LGEYQWPENSLDDTIENLRKIVEIKRLTKELNPQYQQPQSYMPSTDHVSINYTEKLLEKLGFTTFTPETDPLRDRIIGFRCHIYETCLSTNPLPLHGFKESGIIVLSDHRCNPNWIGNLQSLSRLERHSKVKELYRSSLQTMKEAVQNWWFHRVGPHLKIVPLVSAKKDL